MRRNPTRPGLALGCALAATWAIAPHPCAGQSTVAAEPAARRPVVSVSLLDHVLTPSDYHVSVADASLSAGLGAGLGLSGELFVIDGVELGLQVMTLRRDSDDAQLARSVLTHLGVHGGPSFALSEDALLSVVAAVGYHIVSFADAEALTTGLGLGAFANLWLRITGWVWLRAQAGALMQPLGGHSATDVTLPPTALFGLGFAVVAP